MKPEKEMKSEKRVMKRSVQLAQKIAKVEKAHHAEVSETKPQLALLTGATGFIGGYLLRNLLREGDTVCLLVRKESLEKAHALMESIHKEIPKSRGHMCILQGDIAREEVTYEKRDRDFIVQEIETIWHAAAAYRLPLGRREAIRNNYNGAVNMFKLAENMKKLKKFNYVSSIAVSGDFEGVWREDMLDEGQEFTDHYGRSKYLGEVEAKRWSNRLPITIFRPGIVVGHSKTGHMEKMDGPYHLLKVFLKLEKMGFKVPIPFVPAEKGAPIHLVPVDYVANAITEIGRKPGPSGKVYHLTDPRPMDYHEFFEKVCKETGMGCPKRSLPSRWWLDPLLKRPVGSLAAHAFSKVTDLPIENLAYTRKVSYDSTNTKSALNGNGTPPPAGEYLPIIIDYARNQLLPKTPLLPILGNRSPMVL